MNKQFHWNKQYPFHPYYRCMDACIDDDLYLWNAHTHASLKAFAACGARAMDQRRSDASLSLCVGPPPPPVAAPFVINPLDDDDVVFRSVSLSLEERRLLLVGLMFIPVLLPPPDDNDDDDDNDNADCVFVQRLVAMLLS